MKLTARTLGPTGDTDRKLGSSEDAANETARGGTRGLPGGFRFRR